MHKHHSSRSAFTLIEILIVIGCMMILIGLVGSGLFMLMKYQIKADTVRMVDQLTAAISMYCDREKIGSMSLEDPPSNLLDYLYKTPDISNSYFEPNAIFWSTGAVNKSLGGDSLCDAWSTPLNFETWTLNTNSQNISLNTKTSPNTWSYGTSSRGRYLRDGCVIRSNGSSQTASKDDLIWLYTTDSGWRRIQ